MEGGMKISQWIALIISTVLGCLLAGFYVFFCGMFMTTSEGTWLMVVPIAIIVFNVLSIPIYIYVLMGPWRYLYNISITVLTAAICFYGAIEWADSIHRFKGSIGLSVWTTVGAVVSIFGMLISVIISRRKKGI